MASTAPRDPALRGGPDGGGASARLQRFASLESLDLLFVSSNHLANATGLRWFLDKIYGPYLAPLGVSMVVAGSISELGPWPDHPKLEFVGRVRDLAPLYAAARAVVLPIVEGAGGPVKTFEALNYCRPVVATSFALRGIERAPEGVDVADDPAAFAEAVLKLLNDPEARRARRRAIFASGAEIADPERYRIVMDGVMARAMGAKAPPSRPQAASEPPPDGLEWGGLARSINRLIRNLLDDQPLERAALDHLAGLDRDEVAEALRAVSESLFVARDAPALSTDARLLRRALETMGAAPDTVDRLRALMLAAIETSALRANRRRADPDGEGVPALLAAAIPVTIALAGRGADSERRLAVDDASPTAAAEIPPEPESALRFRAVRLRVDGPIVDPGTAIVVEQTFAGADLAALRASNGGPDAAGRAVIVTRGSKTDLKLPCPSLAAPGRLFVDVVLADDGADMARMTATVGGRAVPAAATLRRGREAHRIEIDPAEPLGPFAVLDLSLSLGGDAASALSATIERIDVRYVAAADPKAALEAQDAEAEAPAPLAPGETLTTAQASRAARLLKDLASGRAFNRASATALAALAGDGDDGAARIVEAVARRVGDLASPASRAATAAGLARALGAARPAAAPGRVAFAASPRLTIELLARFAAGFDASRATCRAGGLALPRTGLDGEQAAWLRAGASAVSPADWLGAFEVLDADGRPAPIEEARIRVALVAGADARSAEDPVMASNFHAPERGRDGAAAYAWTGPSPTTTIWAPIALEGPARVHFDVIHFGANLDDSDISVSIDGEALTARVARDADGHGGIVSVEVPGRQGGVAVTEISLGARRTAVPANGDPRSLGIAVGRIEIEYDAATGR